MSQNLTLTLIIVGIALVVLTTIILKKGRISEKHALLWYAMSLIIILAGIIPQVLVEISQKLGFTVMSSFVIGIFIGILIMLTMALTVMIAGQKKKTTLLIQEISLLKAEVEKLKNK